MFRSATPRSSTATRSPSPAPARRLLDAIVAFATLEAIAPAAAGTVEHTSQPHPHRRSLRASRSRRAGAVPAASQHCLCPRRSAGRRGALSRTTARPSR